MIRKPHRRTVGDSTGYELNLGELYGVEPCGRRSVRFASGDTKEAAAAQPRTDEVKIGSKPVHVNPGGATPGSDHCGDSRLKSASPTRLLDRR
jgi:hypothetical protein